MNPNDLKNLRIKHGLTQDDVAKAIGTYQPVISSWENGDYTISKAYQRLLTSYFEGKEKGEKK